MSEILKAAYRVDLSCTLWRIGVTQDNTEFLDLLPAQLREILDKYPSDSDQYHALLRLINQKESHERPVL